MLTVRDATIVAAWSLAEDVLIAIDTSPNVLNLGSSATVVTVHTDIAYNEVKVDENCNKIAELFLNYIPVPNPDSSAISLSWWKADNRGNFVAKFTMDEIKGLPLEIDGYNTFTLVGEIVADDKFSGEQAIMVVARGPANQ